MPSSPRRRRSKKRPSTSSAPTEARDWAALPYDVLLAIFLRLGAREIMQGVEFVCTAWRRIVVDDPALWRRVDMTGVSEWSADIAALVRDAVDRSAGQCEAFSGPWDDESLQYLADRAPSLRSLHLSQYEEDYTSYNVLIRAIKKHPLLEDLDISPSFCDISASRRLF